MAWLVAVTLSGCAVGLGFVGMTAAAAAPVTSRQQVICDPTGEVCSPAPPPPIDPRCSLSSYAAVPGETVVAHLEHVPDGTSATLTFDGTVVGSGTATAKNGETSGSLDISFVVPDGPPDPHHVVFSGAGFQCVASSDFVLGLSITRRPGSSGPLTRTGVDVGILVAIGLALVLAGLQFRRVARRRRRDEEAARRRYAHHYVR
jgi:hypothetical protein